MTDRNTEITTTVRNTEITIEPIVENQSPQSKPCVFNRKIFIITAFFIETLLFIGIMIWFATY